MNIITNLLILYVVLFGSIYFGNEIKPTTTIIENKIYLFFGVFFVQCFLHIANKIRDKCKVDLNKIVSDSSITGLLTVIGYSIFNDLYSIDSTRAYILSYRDNKFATILIMTSLIVVFIAIAKSVGLLFSPTYECDKCNKCEKI